MEMENGHNLKGTFPETNSSHLKIDVKYQFPFGMAVSRSVAILLEIHPFFIES